MLSFYCSFSLIFVFRFAAIGTRDGTAKSGEDFRGKSQSQVQFNPGQTEGIWKVKILQVKMTENYV